MLHADHAEIGQARLRWLQPGWPGSQENSGVRLPSPPGHWPLAQDTSSQPNLEDVARAENGCLAETSRRSKLFRNRIAGEKRRHRRQWRAVAMRSSLAERREHGGCGREADPHWTLE